MTSPSKTWKDEAIAFVFLAISIILFMRAWNFFTASHKELVPQLQSYTPREKAHARDLDYDYAPPMGSGYIGIGTATIGSAFIIPVDTPIYAPWYRAATTPGEERAGDGLD